MAIIFVVVNCIRLRSIFPKHLEFQRATAGYSMPYFRRFATRLFANAIVNLNGSGRHLSGQGLLGPLSGINFMFIL